MDSARAGAKQMIYKLDAKRKPDIKEDYKEIVPIVLVPPQTFKRRITGLGSRHLFHVEDVDLVPERIPLYFKIPVKDLNGPIKICFHYTKSGDPKFSAILADLWVFISESDPMPQNLFLSNNGIDEKPLKRDSQTKASFGEAPIEMTVMPVDQKYLLGLNSNKVKRFNCEYLYMTLMSKEGSYKV